jgi:hypothetical protein
MAEKPKRPVLHVRTAKREPPPEVVMEDLNNLSGAAQGMLSPTPEPSIRLVRARIEEAFNAFGTDALPGTVMPAGRANNSAEAAEFVLADLLKKLAEQRLKNALEAAEKAGVFGNNDQYVTGDTVMVYSDPNFSINVKLGKPSKLINRDAVEASASEFLGKRASEFLERCFKPRAATKQIIVSMK